ncbi:MAG: hypothetical protein ACLQUY_16935 [Ktedonobacterales bacterium]
MSESHESTGNPEPTVDDMPTTVEISQPSSTTPPSPAPPVKQRKRSGRRILISVLVVIIILAAGGFGGYHYAVQQYNQLSALGTQLCDNLEAHKYDSLYQHFSDGLKSQFTKSEFMRYGAEIDQFEGDVVNCGQTSGNHFSIDVGQRTLTVASFADREGSGTHSGNVRFQFTGNSWTVDGFEAGFLGVSLGALKAFDNYCGALLARNYRAYYQLMAPGLHTESEQQFLQDAYLHQQIDGIALQCTLTGIGKSNTNTASTLTVDIHRVEYDVTGTVTFGRASGGWELTGFDPALQGRDLAPVAVVTRWCSDMKSQNYTDAFGLLTSQSQQGSSVNALGAKYSGMDGGVKWLDCAADPSTYQGDNTGVSLAAQVQHTGPSVVPGMPDHAMFYLSPENATWKIILLFICSNAACGLDILQ